MCVWVCGVFVMYLGASAKSNTIISFNFQCHLNRRRKSFLINFLLHKGVENLQQIAVQKICVFPLSLATPPPSLKFSFHFQLTCLEFSYNYYMEESDFLSREKERKTTQGGRVEWKYFLLFLTIFKSFLLNLTCYPPLRLSFMLVSYDNLFIDFYIVVAYTMECVETFKYIMRNINFVFALHLDPKCVCFVIISIAYIRSYCMLSSN